MSQRKPTTQMRSLRPLAESLETRQLLSSTNLTTPTAVARGTDPDGTQWTLRLFGPGALSVVGVDGVVFDKTTQGVTDSIQTITVGGAITTQTRLVGTVQGTTGLSKVMFENLNVTPTGALGKIDLGQVDNFRSVQNGIEAIDMPDFYLAHTEPITTTTKPSTQSLIHSNGTTFSAGQIFIPQGVITLRFGGVDVDYVSPLVSNTLPLNATGQSNEFQIVLGLPIVQGTSIIVNSVNSNAEANTTTPTQPFQDYATFLVSGRLNLFQANQITGNTTAGLVPSQFPNQTTPTSHDPGGTYVVSDASPTTGVTGQIGNVRIGGAATNLTTFITEDPITAIAAEGQLDAKISNFSIGGQTNNVLLVAPSGSRNIAFGLGMDNVTINSVAISSLRANRDASNSQVTVSRSIGNLLVGGDVTNTNINVGESQSLFTFANIPPGISAAQILTGAPANGSGVFWGDLPPTVANPQINLITQQTEPFAQNGGTIAARIAGSVNGSVISASDDPNPSDLLTPVFGAGQGDLQLPRGVINAKVEGTISNANNPLVSDAGKAFFARTVHLTRGAVIPPRVPYAPYPAPTVYHKGQNALRGLFKIDHNPRIIRTK
jgi:hypothetical protein